MPADRISVLFVCLGNICRSPTVEGVVRHAALNTPLRERLTVDSAGTGGYHTGEAPDARAVEAAARRGVDIAGLRARRITAGDYRQFDLILAMDRANLGELLRRRPAEASAQLGLFLEYAGYAGATEVPDPYYGGAADFERVLDLACGAAPLLLRRLLEERT